MPILQLVFSICFGGLFSWMGVGLHGVDFVRLGIAAHLIAVPLSRGRHTLAILAWEQTASPCPPGNILQSRFLPMRDQHCISLSSGLDTRVAMFQVLTLCSEVLWFAGTASASRKTLSKAATKDVAGQGDDRDDITAV